MALTPDTSSPAPTHKPRLTIAKALERPVVVSETAGGAAALSARIHLGDRAALAEFYEGWFDRAFALARRLTGRDEAFCLDVVQDSMLRVAKSMRVMKTDADVERWMVRVIHTAALDLLRQESRRVRRERSRGDSLSRDGAGESDSALADRIRWLREEIAVLPDRERSLLGLRFGRGRSLAQAGAETGITGPAAHGIIRRTLARLRRAGKELFHED